MRTFIIAIIVLTVIVSGIIGYHFYCDKTAKDLEELAFSENAVSADGAENLYAYWEKKRFALHLGINSELIDSVEEHILTLRAAINSGSGENTAEAIELLRYELSELRKANSLSLENIL